MTTMPPCHTGDGVKAAQPRGASTPVALPAYGRLVLAGTGHRAAAIAPAIVLHSTFLDPHTPPPRLG
jgi:hypothetical protein